MPLLLGVGEEGLVLLRGKNVELCLAGGLIRHDALPFLYPFLRLSLGVLPSVVELVQLVCILRYANYKFLLSIDQLG